MQGTTQKGYGAERTGSAMALGRCLVEGDLDALWRARSTRRKTFGVSLAIEILLLGLLVAAPLLRGVAQPNLSRPTYLPFVFGGSRAKRAVARPAPPNPQEPSFPKNSLIDFSNQLPRRPSQPGEGVGDTASPEFDVMPGLPNPELSSFVGQPPAHPGAPPEEIKRSSEKPPLKLSEPVVNAQLISRIEPSYPPLGLQMRREGTVVLHAIISRDGHIDALEVVSGSPFFVQAALDAVRQWRYRPTLLNGEPVEVETTITVIFRLHE